MAFFPFFFFFSGMIGLARKSRCLALSYWLSVCPGNGAVLGGRVGGGKRGISASHFQFFHHKTYPASRLWIGEKIPHSGVTDHLQEKVSGIERNVSI